MGSAAMKVRYFKSANDFRRWLEKNHPTTQELWVGYYKKSSEQPSITWPESVKEALCFGWIDGIRKSVDEESYTIRFTPRQRSSIWSSINIKYATELKKHKTAWTFFESQAAWYRKQMSWWIVSAKQEETRLKRLKKLIEESAA